MPVYLDVESRLDQRVLAATARDAMAWATRLGGDISKGLGHSMSTAFNALDSSSARAEIAAMQGEYQRLAAAEAEAARVAVRSAGEVEVATRRATEVTARYSEASSQAARAQVVLADAQARAARDMRINADAIVATEAAHRQLGTATEETAATAAAASRVMNGIGMAAFVTYGATMLETTKKAGDFEQSQQRLVSSAGESAANLKIVSDGILQLAGQVGYSAQELSHGMYTVEKAGYRGADGVNVMRSAAQLAKAENADLTEVLNGLTTSMHDFNYGPERAAEVASKMNTAVGEAKTNLQEFSGALHSVEPIAAAAGLKLEDVYGSLAQITQSGTSAAQGAQNMAHSISQLLKPTQQMREEMAAMGIDARDVQAHLGDRGYAGTVQMLSDTIRSHMNPAQQVVIDTMFKSQQATQAATEMFDHLPPAAHRVAEAIKDGTMSFKEFRKSRGGLSVEDANLIGQWANLNNKVEGFSNALKTGQGDIQTYEQALALMTGGQDSLRTVLQLVGENAEATNNKIKAVKDTTAETDGTVKGFNETQQTLNAKMADAKAAFGAAAIEIGSAFVPIMTQVASIAKDVGDAMAKHPGIAHAVVDALGVMGGAWLLFKGYNIASTVLEPIATKLIAITAAEDTATISAMGLKDKLMALGPAAAIAAGAIAGKELVNQSMKAPAIHDRFMNPDNTPKNSIDRWIVDNDIPILSWLEPDSMKPTGHASGGPIHGRGPRGHDSVPAMLAPGEHVLTHHDVAAMGGHGAVHAFRNALHLAGGGGIGPDVMAAESMVGTPYSQNSRHDCSGMVARTICRALGLPETNLPSTMNMGQWLASLGFHMGSGGPGAISVGWYDHGGGNAGHAAMTLSNGMNAESGGSHGNFLVGAGAAGANSSQFDHHMFLPTPYGQGAASGGGMGGLGAFGAAGGGGGGGMGGGGIPAGGTAGTGPGGQAGYYMPDQHKVATAEERLRHLDAEIATAEKRKTEMKATAKQSERDRLDEEIRHLHEERNQAQEKLTEAQRGTFHASRGGGRSGGGGTAGLPVALPDNFGLGEGLPGLAKWAISFLEDMALGPLETAMMNGGGSGMAPGSGSSGGGYADLGMPAGATALTAGIGPDIGGGAGGGGGGGGAAGAPGGGVHATPGPPSNGPAPTAAPPAPAPAPPAPPAAGPSGLDRFAEEWQRRRQGLPPAPSSQRSVPRVDYPGQSDIPPELRQWAIANGMVDASGKYIGPPIPTTSPGAPIMTVPRGPFPGDAPTPRGGGIFGRDKQEMPGVNPGAVPSHHFSTGGPSGTDTIPAWLSPGEFVMNSDATKQWLPQLQFMNAGHYDTGTEDPIHPPGQPPAPAAKPGQPKPGPPGVKDAKDTSGAPKPGEGGGPMKPAAVGGDAAGTGQTRSGLGKPGESKELFGEGQNSPGLGLGGGVLGSAEGAAAMGADAFAPGSGAAAQMAFQLINRTAAYGAQAGAIGVEAILETALPADSPLSNFSNTLPGKILTGISGAKPSQPNTAGQTKAPLTNDQGGGGQGGGEPGSQVGFQVMGDMHVSTPNADQFHNDLSRMYAGATANYPGNKV